GGAPLRRPAGGGERRRVAGVGVGDVPLVLGRLRQVPGDPRRQRLPQGVRVSVGAPGMSFVLAMDTRQYFPGGWAGCAAATWAAAMSTCAAVGWAGTEPAGPLSFDMSPLMILSTASGTTTAATTATAT